MSVATQVCRVLRTPSEPIFNVPGIVAATIEALVALHGVREWVLSPEADNDLLWLFAFVPVRYQASVFGQGAFPGGIAADVWTFVTYAFLRSLARLDLAPSVVGALKAPADEEAAGSKQ